MSGPLMDSGQLPGLRSFYAVDYGEIRLYAESDGGIPGDDVYHQARAGAAAGFLDRLTLNVAGLPEYAPLTLRVRVDVHGLLLAAGGGSANYQVVLASSGTGGDFGGYINGARYGPSYGLGDEIYGDDFGSFVFDLPFANGHGSTLNLRLDASADTSDRQPGYAKSDLSNTVRWGGVVDVLNGEGVAVDAFTLTSESGYDYATLQPLLVSEPATTWLLLAGLGGWVLRRR